MEEIMALFQKPFGEQQKTKDVGTNIRWISERHVACAFLLDTSGSMGTNDAIGKLNEGLRTFKTQTMNDSQFDEHTKACIDVALISFGPNVVLRQDFVPVSEMEPPVLSADGQTPMGEALNMAMDIIAEQKKRYNDSSTPYYRPWIFCITDGEPNDSYQGAVQRLRKMEDENRILGYCVGVENFNRAVMATIFNKERIFELKNLDYPSLFKFVSSSLAAARNSGETSGGAVAQEAPSTLKMAF
ncbi:MAG: VWA domain-containing protein [Treponema sp.]|jgi:uncharacterized protein YegL|nr:VWA domain-containing protein [Treponema sp.]